MAVTNSPRFAIPQWGAGTDPDTRAQHNQITAQLEALGVIMLEGTAALRGGVGHVAKRLYRATDTGVISVDTGTAWIDLNPPTADLAPLLMMRVGA